MKLLFLLVLLFTGVANSAPTVKKSVTYDEIRKEFIIVVDRKFIMSLESSKFETRSSSFNKGNFPQKFNEVFINEKN